MLTTLGEAWERKKRMRCPYCLFAETQVLESRVAENGRALRRRRQCEKCTKRFTTYERVEGIDIFVLKKNGEREKFDREKVKKGLLKATWNRPVSLEQVEELIDEVERVLRQRQTSEIKSWEVGKEVLKRLRGLDPLSSLLFASVYRDFRTLEDFHKEVQALLEKK